MASTQVELEFLGFQNFLVIFNEKYLPLAAAGGNRHVLVRIV